MSVHDPFSDIKRHGSFALQDRPFDGFLHHLKRVLKGYDVEYMSRCALIVIATTSSVIVKFTFPYSCNLSGISNEFEVSVGIDPSD